MATRRAQPSEIESLEDVRRFADEQEEAEYWQSHGLGDELLEQMVPIGEDVLPQPRPRTRPLAVRFDQDVVRRLKALAKVKHKGYQTLLKEFVAERLYEEEKREGLLG